MQKLQSLYNGKVKILVKKLLVLEGDSERYVQIFSEVALSLELCKWLSLIPKPIEALLRQGSRTRNACVK